MKRWLKKHTAPDRRWPFWWIGLHTFWRPKSKLPRGVKVIGLGEHGMALTVERPLTASEVETIKAYWVAQYSGPGNATRIQEIL